MSSCARALVYIRSSHPSPLMPVSRSPVAGGRYREGVGPGAPIERSLREIYRLRRVCEFEISPIRIAPPVARTPRQPPGPFPPLPPRPRPAATPAEERSFGTSSERGKRDVKGVECRRGTTATSRPMIKTRRITAASPISPHLPSFLPSFPYVVDCPASPAFCFSPRIFRVLADMKIRCIRKRTLDKLVRISSWSY